MLLLFSAAFIALPILIGGSNIISFLRGLRLLNELRDRFPEMYLRAD